MFPGSSPTDFSYGACYEPFAAFRDRTLFFHGLDNVISGLSRPGGHPGGERSAFTCVPMTSALAADGSVLPWDSQPDDVSSAHASGPSIEQVVAERIRDGQPYKSMDVAVGRDFTGIFYAGSNDPIETEGDPLSVLDRFFTPEDADLAALEALRSRRLSVLDGVLDNFNELQARVGRDDRDRLQAHADKIRDIENRFASSLGVCAGPEISLPADFDQRRDLEASAKAQIDLVVAGLNCNAAPVASLSFTEGHAPFSDWTFGPNNAPVVPSAYSDWHGMVHLGNPRDGTAEPGLVEGFRWYGEQFNYLLEQLDATPEGEGSMLDNTLVVWLSEFGLGRRHYSTNMHCVIAGNMGPDVPMGRLHNWTDDYLSEYARSEVTHSQLMVSILRAFGETDDRFGWHEGNWGSETRAIPTGPLPDIYG